MDLIDHQSNASGSIGKARFRSNPKVRPARGYGYIHGCLSISDYHPREKNKIIYVMQATLKGT